MKVNKHYQLNCHLYSFLHFNKQTSLEEMVDKIPKIWDRIAGYETKEKLISLLTGFKGERDINNLLIFHPDEEKEILERAEEVITKCAKALPFEDTFQIFFFPTSSKFILEYMQGISGFASFKNTFLVFIHPQSNLSLLEETIVHEYNHAIILNKIRWLTLGEGIVAEGLAEKFREDLIGGDGTPWIKSLNKEQSKHWFKKIEEYLPQENQQRYRDIFTNPKSEYPHWGGYAIGYWLVKEFLELNPNLTWQQIMDKDVEEIIEKSRFGVNLSMKIPVS